MLKLVESCTVLLYYDFVHFSEQKFTHDQCDLIENIYQNKCDDSLVVRPDHSIEYDEVS